METRCSRMFYAVFVDLFDKSNACYGVVTHTYQKNDGQIKIKTSGPDWDIRANLG